jgi:hypothetical protein
MITSVEKKTQCKSNSKKNLMKNWGGDACQELNSIAITMKKIERHKDPLRRWCWHRWKIELDNNNNEIK